MASGRFFDPITFLRVAPLVTSTASLVIANDSHLFLSSLLAVKRHRAEVNVIAPRYFEEFFWRGLPEIFVTFGLSIAFGLANVYYKPYAASRFWYAGASALALLHFTFVPTIAQTVKATVESEEIPDGKAREAIRGWLDVHHVRMVVSDIPSWTCFFVAALKALTPI
ncbi:uncharacterized protein F4822DRAFT_405848 [Hypoxylon trugodes]|uniref:uncharacterized protein n=1 Tax=Hypoxylon trugodes TaxID=326681 RepID=UPI00218ED4F6|nr:uncharacterized protein F4822DRAFT_405848 [Hypoxylon trugodes]KAI1387244.1 hypothetical protein F4822DRAFT_405848 [Hypoxylon trugodes]